MSRPPTSSTAGSAAPPSPSKKTGMPGSKALAWAVVGMAALRRRKATTSARRARIDPFRPRPPRHTNGSAPAARSGPAHSGPAHSGSAHSGPAHSGPAHHPHGPDLWPRDFGRDGVSGLLTGDRAMRARDVSRPDSEDERIASEVVAELLSRVDGRRPPPARRSP